MPRGQFFWWSDRILNLVFLFRNVINRRKQKFLSAAPASFLSAYYFSYRSKVYTRLSSMVGDPSFKMDAEQAVKFIKVSLASGWQPTVPIHSVTCKSLVRF